MLLSTKQYFSPKHLLRVLFLIHRDKGKQKINNQCKTITYSLANLGTEAGLQAPSINSQAPKSDLKNISELSIYFYRDN